MGELLKDIRTIKMYTWEPMFVKRIMQCRERELKQLSVRKPQGLICSSFQIEFDSKRLEYP